MMTYAETESDEDRIEMECIIIDALVELRDFLDGYEDITVEAWTYHDRQALKCFDTSFGGQRLMFAAFGDTLEEALTVLTLTFAEYYRTLTPNDHAGS